VGTPKYLVHADPVDNEEAFDHHILEICQNIRNYPGIFERMRRSMMRHVEACTKYHGGHFDRSAVTHKLNVSRHMLMWTFFPCFGMWNSRQKFVLSFEVWL
jgi:hypothetical protein